MEIGQDEQKHENVRSIPGAAERSVYCDFVCFDQTTQKMHVFGLTGEVKCDSAFLLCVPATLKKACIKTMHCEIPKQTRH